MKSLTGEEGNRRRETMKRKVRRGKKNIFSERVEHLEKDLPEKDHKDDQVSKKTKTVLLWQPSESRSPTKKRQVPCGQKVQFQWIWNCGNCCGFNRSLTATHLVKWKERRDISSPKHPVSKLFFVCSLNSLIYRIECILKRFLSYFIFKGSQNRLEITILNYKNFLKFYFK